MHILLSKEWEQLYRTVWRAPFAHLSKLERAKLVGSCRGKFVFDSIGEADKMLRMMQPEGKLRLSAYCCPLCQSLHIGNRRVIASYRRVLKLSQASSPASGLDCGR